jgi:hypothetical protein
MRKRGRRTQAKTVGSLGAPGRLLAAAARAGIELRVAGYEAARRASAAIRLFADRYTADRGGTDRA